MERMTEYDGGYYVDESLCSERIYGIHNCSDSIGIAGDAISLLAEYENTGLTPEEIIQMSKTLNELAIIHVENLCNKFINKKQDEI